MPTKEGLAKLYDAAAWQRRRALQLKQLPLCAECLRAGAVTPATCVDHVERWRAGRADDINRFLLEPIQSLCENCHNRKTAAERLGTGPVIRSSLVTMAGRSIQTTRPIARALRGKPLSGWPAKLPNQIQFRGEANMNRQQGTD